MKREHFERAEPCAIAIDPALRNVGVVRVSESGIAWKVLRTPTPRAGRERKPFEAVFRDQEDAVNLGRALMHEVGCWSTEPVNEADPHDFAFYGDPFTRFVAAEIATAGKESRAMAGMFIVRGLLAVVEAALRAAGAKFRRVLPLEVKRAAGVVPLAPLRRPERPPPGAMAERVLEYREQQRSYSRERSRRENLTKALVERHVLEHFPELLGVEANVGVSRKDHVFDAMAVMIAASFEEGLDFLGERMLGRLRAARVEEWRPVTAAAAES